MAFNSRQIFKKFRGSMSPDFLELFCFSVYFEVILPEKTALKKCQNQNLVPLQKKNSEYAPDIKLFQRVHLRPFPGQNGFVFGLY